MIEKTILNQLATNEDYARKVLPHLKSEYFTELSSKTVYELIQEYVDSYNQVPNKTVLLVELDKKDKLSEEIYKQAKLTILEMESQSGEIKWYVDTTEKWCQERAVYNAIMNSIQIIDGKAQQSPGAIPKLLSDALSVSFDTTIGHDFLEDAETRYDYYHRVEEKIPFDLDYFNKITRGGLSRKSLNIALAGTGVGKSLFMCHCAAANLTEGRNVLYITLEMSEEKIAERIDANLMNVMVDELSILPRDAYEKKLERIRQKTTGKLIIKEYPTTSAGAANFRHLINELKLKKGFEPDIIYIDYLNICMSSRLKYGAGVNSYTYVKAIAEELRGLAVEFNLPIVSATQTTRSGYSSSDVGLEDTSESFGLPATADLMFALISTEELQDLGQIMVKQLKNRYADPSTNRRFVIGVDRPRMRLYDVEQHAQADVLDGPAFDNTPSGKRFDKKASFDNFS